MIEFLEKKGCEDPEIRRILLAVYGATTITVSNVRRQMKRFLKENSTVLDKQQTGRPTTAVTDTCQEAMSERTCCLLGIRTFTRIENDGQYFEQANIINNISKFYIFAPANKNLMRDEA